ncbi:3-keto-disaccharide hydrolase [Anaerorudis cellulosivorans]|uniref:3-keto-disaccharide hydrolase n=1 Tax=Anaerorudis cellulosivorans TaxID=3397862 RepID=UPI00221ED12D|nr:DUF1080 domain-containing protein [Seramator thermalis]MCW1736203.1 DUF1080 domain-containing protein [Seramator thermalis]
MKKISIIPILLLLPAYIVVAQTKGAMEMKPEMTEIWDPEVPIVKSGKTLSEPPTDAIILFDGSDLSKEWTNSKGEKPTWKVENGCLTVLKGAGDIKTKRVFEDCQLHIEWRSPEKVEGEGQGRGNSGILLQERYEIQVLDSYNNRTYRNGQAASIYKQYAPLVNVCKAPGEWQTYDIIYTAPRFKDDGTFFTPPMITVIHNGVVVQNHVKLRGPTLYIGIPEYAVKKHGAAAIVLQDHGNPVSFRNIWIRKL